MVLQKIAGVREVAPGAVKKIVVGKKVLALFNIGGKFYCIDGECPHRGGPLYEGTVEGTDLICPWHGSRFDLTNGQVKNGPAAGGVRAYKTRIIASDLFVEI